MRGRQSGQPLPFTATSTMPPCCGSHPTPSRMSEGRSRPGSSVPREASRILGTARSHRGRPATDSEWDKGASTAAHSGPARDTHDLLGDHLPLSEPDWDEFLQRRSSWDLAMACQPVAPDAHRRSKGLSALPHRGSSHDHRRGTGTRGAPMMRQDRSVATGRCAPSAEASVSVNELKCRLVRLAVEERVEQDLEHGARRRHVREKRCARAKFHVIR